MGFQPFGALNVFGFPNVLDTHTHMFGFQNSCLREFVYELPSSWSPARVEGGSGQQSMTPDPGDNRDPRDPRIVPGGLLLSNTHTLSAYGRVQDGFGRFWGQN